MNLKELRAPLIAYWDLCPEHPLKPEIINDLCEELVSNGILVLYIWDMAKSMSNESSIILRNMRDKNISMVLTMEYPAFNILKSPLPDIKSILIQTESLDEISSSVDKIRSRKADIRSFGFSFPISGQTFDIIPDLLRLCMNLDVKEIHFPIQRIDQRVLGVDPIRFGWLYREIETIDISGMNIIIHDPFISKIFNKGAIKNQEGCQGANTMIYITPSLDVTPCPLLPVTMGSLKYRNLKEILLSENRHEIRRSLGMPPEDCDICTEKYSCLGGCRGRAFVRHGNLDSADPLCPQRIKT